MKLRWRPESFRALVRTHGPVALIGLVYAAILLAVYHATWLDESTRFFGWDALREYWPDIVFPTGAFADGDLGLWNPYSNGGYDFYGDPSAGVTNPINWFVWLLAGITGDSGSWLVQTRILLGMWIGMISMHALVWSRSRSHLAAMIATVVYILGAPLLVNKNSALMWPLEILPLAVLAVQAFTKAPSLRRAVLVGAVVWLLYGCSSPPSFFYSLLVVIPFWMYRTAISPAGAGASLRAQLPWSPLALGIFGALVLVTLLPQIEVMSVSTRADRSLAFILEQPLEWSMLGEIFLPGLDNNWMTDLYMGPLALVCVAFSLAARRGRARMTSVFWLALGGFGLTLALGQHLPLLPTLAEHLPGFGSFRLPYRYKVIWAFCLAVIAGDALGHIVHQNTGRASRATLAATATVALLWVAWAIINLVRAHGDATAAIRWSLILGGASVLAIVLAVALTRWRVPLIIVAGLLVVADLWSAGQKKINILQRPPDAAVRSLAATAGQLEGVAEHTYRFANLDAPSSNRATIIELRDFMGYPVQSLLQRHADVTEAAKRDHSILRHFNVRWLLKRGTPPRSRRGTTSAAGSGTYEVGKPSPIVRVYGRSESLPRTEVLKVLKRPGSAQAALVEPEDAPEGALPAEGYAPVDGQLLHFSREFVQVRVSAPGPGIAVLNEVYFPGWRAQVNGKPAPVFRANYLLRAVVVPEGESTITFEYAPSGFTLLLLLFLLAVALVITLGVFGRRPDHWVRKRLKRSHPS